jgi:hypothetical protein
MADERGPENLEAIAFQLLLHTMTGMERDLKSIASLLQQVITQLETQQKEPEMDVARYADLYPEMAEAEDVRAADALPPLPPPPRWRRWLRKER